MFVTIDREMIMNMKFSQINHCLSSIIFLLYY